MPYEVNAFYPWSQVVDLVPTQLIPGPDSQKREDVVVSDASLCFVVSTLHLRGAVAVPQPHSSERSIFCWNGEIFEGLDIPAESNDGSVLFSALDAAEDAEDICSVISKIEGPYAFVFYQRRTNRLFFARDPLGRRSLLVRHPHPSNACFILSSVSLGVRGTHGFEEVDPRYIHCLELSQLYNSESYSEESILTLERTNSGEPTFFTELNVVQGNFARVNATLPDTPRPINILKPLPNDLALVTQHFIEVLDKSIRLRVRNIPQSSLNMKAARVAVLYSGGIDSTMIAFLADRYIPLDEPIDLLNVAFENPRKLQSCQAGSHSKGKHKQSMTLQSRFLHGDETYKVPDRITGLEQLEELRKLCPGRQWNFVEIDVDYAESSAAKELVERIMFPSRTVMDLSLAIALYFASRGFGRVRDASGTSVPYTSNARVLLSGLGSDELLGGYGRHRSAFTTGGWRALVEQLQLELDRLPSRNLGRDDRVISCHGKETRYPFLSLSVVDFLAKLPVHLKVDPRLEVGLGDKLLLRLAALRLGLESASKQKKKAMQFGSHSARMESGGYRRGEHDLYEVQ